MDRQLRPPKDVVEKQEKEAERVEKFLRARLMRLSPERTATIEKDIDRKYQSWMKQTKTMRNRCIRYKDLLDGVVDETNFPFEGASNITTHYAAGLTRTFRSTFNKAMYQDEDLAVPVLDPELNMRQSAFDNLQDGFNYTLGYKSNGLDALKSLTVPIARDGTGILSGEWRREVELATEIRTYQDFESFQKDYPDAQTAGINEDDYKDIAGQFIVSEDPTLTVSYDVDFVKFDGIEYHIESRAKFINFPTFVPKISDMEMYGTWDTISETELKTRKKRQQVYQNGADKVLAKLSEYKPTDWDRANFLTSGIYPTTTEEKDDKPINKLDLVYKTDLDDDGIPEKYVIEYAPDAKALLGMRRYTLRKNIDMCVEFRFLEKENQFDGVSLIGDNEDCFNEIDTLHRHRNNVRILTTSPQYMANKNYKDDIDLGRSESVTRPGVTYWVEDITKAMKQLEVANIDAFGNGMDEESKLQQYVELNFGVSQGMSGMQTPTDPKAPARKTQMLLMQANQLIDDKMDTFRKSLPRFFELHATLLVQYAAVKEMKFDKNNQVRKFPLQLLANDMISWAPKRRSVNLTPEFAMARLQNLAMIYAQLLPLLMKGDSVAVEMWNRQVHNSGEPQSEKLMIDEKKGQMLAQNAAAQAEMAERKKLAMKADGQGQNAFKKEVGKAAGKAVGGAMVTANGGNMDLVGGENGNGVQA